MVDSTQILVVDDNLAMLAAVGRVLRGAGHEVLEAATGEEALRLAEAHHPALILLDVRLPDANGVDLCRTLKSDPSFADTFIVLLSSIDITPENQVVGLDAGAVSYITRPVHHRELVARVGALLRIQSAERRLRESETLWRTVFAAANDPLLLLDADMSIQACNRRATDLYGFTEEELRSMPLREVSAPQADGSNNRCGCCGAPTVSSAAASTCSPCGASGPCKSAAPHCPAATTSPRRRPRPWSR